MLEMHLRQPQFTYSACGPFTKHKQRIQKFKEIGDTNYIYKNKLDKACFAHDAAYSDSKDLTKRNPKYDLYQRGLASKVYKFFDKKSASLADKSTEGSGVNTKLAPQNQQLAEELHKPISKKFKKRKVQAAFKDNIWGADLADMQLLSRHNKGIKFLLCVIDIFSKYAWVVPLKDKKGISIVTAFQSILKQSNKKPNKIWVDKGFEFYNASFKKWLQDNNIVIYSRHTSLKPIDVKDNTNINTNKETNDKDPKFKVGDRVRISKYKNIFAKDYTPNWSEEVFVIKKVKNTVPWTYIINDLNGEEITRTFYEKELQKANQEEFRIEKVIKRKGNKIYVK